MTEEKIREGYWSIAAQKHLKEYRSDSTNIDELDNLSIAGKAGRFIGVIRNNDKIENIKKLEKMANGVGITKSDLHRIILPEIQKASDGKLELIKDSSGDIIGIQEYFFDNKSVLETAGTVFEKQNPSDLERIAITTMDETRKLPFLESEMGDKLEQYGFKENDISLSFTIQEQFKLIQRLRVKNHNDPIISNEYVWGINHAKIATAIAGLDLGKKQNLSNVIDIIQSEQGKPIEKLPPIDNNLLFLAEKTGMIVPTQIMSTRGLEKSFAFSADISGKLDFNDDILDDVKLLLASIRFGENYTQYSRIRDPKKFINALINQDFVGPHTANETDYTLLEKRGIIKVVQKSVFNNYTGTLTTGPCLKLIRKDVATAALELLDKTQYSIPYTNDFGSPDALLTASDFVSPEETRIRLGKSPEPITEALEYLSRAIRDEEI